MSRKRHKPEEIVAKLRQVDVLTAQGTPVADAVRSIGVAEVTYYRWRQEYGGLKSNPVFPGCGSWREHRPGIAALSVRFRTPATLFRPATPSDGWGSRGGRALGLHPAAGPGAAGGARRPSAHSSPLGSRYRSTPLRHVAGAGGPRSRSIRRRIAANSARGTAISASWNTT
jgi:hypothetical protein